MHDTIKPLVRIVDDDEGMRRAYRFMLEAEGWNVATYADAMEFLTGDAPSVPGCVLLDVRMPGMSGLELHHEMVQRGYTVPVIFLTAHGDIDMAVQTMKDGAVDFMTKPVEEDRLVRAIAQAVERDRRSRTGQKDPRQERALFETLTSREADVARLVAQGLLNREVGSALGISEKTVQVYRAGACRKLGVRSAAELAELLIRIDVMSRS